MNRRKTGVKSSCRKPYESSQGKPGVKPIRSEHVRIGETRVKSIQATHTNRRRGSSHTEASTRGKPASPHTNQRSEPRKKRGQGEHVRKTRKPHTNRRSERCRKQPESENSHQGKPGLMGSKSRCGQDCGTDEGAIGNSRTSLGLGSPNRIGIAK